VDLGHQVEQRLVHGPLPPSPPRQKILEPFPRLGFSESGWEVKVLRPSEPRVSELGGEEEPREEGGGGAAHGV
jgi:hypothetical protein